MITIRIVSLTRPVLLMSLVSGKGLDLVGKYFPYLLNWGMKNVIGKEREALCTRTAYAIGLVI